MRKMPDINGQGSYITWIHVTAQILDIATKTVRIKTPNTSTAESAFDAGFERIAQEALDMNKVIIVGKIGNGQCIVTAILQRSFDPKSGHLMELKIERLN
ncbi:hypothetical protein CMV_025336 [Castanea mollissima]|uniref:Uncharacterized protein n=1 Tax=Castanea mollissima TaxID=60419 RepID=A0A8J4VH14_9ROSI|nr:hypothetical protein CMV_025336 [Castanea mollissima]